MEHSIHRISCKTAKYFVITCLWLLMGVPVRSYNKLLSLHLTGAFEGLIFDMNWLILAFHVLSSRGATTGYSCLKFIALSLTSSSVVWLQCHTFYMSPCPATSIGIQDFDCLFNLLGSSGSVRHMSVFFWPFLLVLRSVINMKNNCTKFCALNFLFFLVLCLWVIPW